MDGLKPSPKSPKSHLSGKFGPEIPDPSIETGGIGDGLQAIEFGGPFAGAHAGVPVRGRRRLHPRDRRDAFDILNKGN